MFKISQLYHKRQTGQHSLCKIEIKTENRIPILINFKFFCKIYIFKTQIPNMSNTSPFLRQNSVAGPFESSIAENIVSAAPSPFGLQRQTSVSVPSPFGSSVSTPKEDVLPKSA
jgi:hypothetical protein